MLRVSIGTAGALGLVQLKQSPLPTTAYFLVGDRCTRRCEFCAQAATAAADADRLSRVTWPKYSLPEIISAWRSGRPAARHWQRICLQVTASVRWEELTLDVLAAFKKEIPGIPICVSIQPGGLRPVATLLQAGADKVTLPLDAVEPGIYRRVKHGNWYRAYECLLAAARSYPGRIGTHIIVGLGETEKSICLLLASLLEAGITVGLFAFTPVRGTGLVEQRPPAIASYRRIQIVLALLRWGIITCESMVFAGEKLVDIRADRKVILPKLWSGQAFRTAGCPGCNRPYFNERPGTVLYNYPYSPTEEEIRQALLASGLFTVGEIESTRPESGTLPQLTET